MSAKGRRSAPKPGLASKPGKTSERRRTLRPAASAEGEATPPAYSVCRDRLGLALAGGGFRAALFHVGVFRRLAELDLLRYVEVLSTVSGGSIAGALYVLLLKRELERTEGKNRLERREYGKIVDDLEARLAAGIRANLRARLFANPFDLLRILVRPGRSLGDRMAELYEERIYRGTIRELDREHPGQPLLLQELLIKPGRREIAHWPPHGDIDSYNREQVERGGSAVTKLVINATSLNTGARFLFKATEIGEWHYGYVRVEEAGDLADRKREIDVILREPRARRETAIENESKRSLARWVITGERSHLPAGAKGLMDSWPSRFDAGTGRGRGAGLAALRTAELGLLRQARIAAWHMRKLLKSPALTDSGGFTLEEHRLDLAVALGVITHDYPARVHAWLDANKRRAAPLCDLIDRVYLYRSARNLAAGIEADANQWRLSQAVAASANFPPVFPPLLVLGTYDDLTVSRLGLTDGGVYDNLGVVGLMDEGCNYIISSDTGLIEKPVQHVSQGRLGMMGRIVDITTDGAARHVRNLLVDRHLVSAGLETVYRAAVGQQGKLAGDLKLVHATRRLHGYAGMRIDSPAVLELEGLERKNGGGRLPAFDAGVVGAIRTDLDSFGDIEVNVLINQGYANAGLYVKRWLDYADNRAAKDERPAHARARYTAGACGGYQYTAARDSRYRDARAQPLRPIADTTAAGEPDGSDRRADWAVRIGRFRFFRAFRWRWPPDRWFVGAWSLVLAAAAVLFGFRAAFAFTAPGLRLPPIDVNAAAVLSAAIALAAIFLLPGLIRAGIAAWIRRAEDAGKLGLARRLARARRVPAKLAFWLALAGLVVFTAAFLPSGPQRILAEQFRTATQSVLIELVLVVALAFLLAALALVWRLDGYLAAASQRLNETGRPPGADDRVERRKRYGDAARAVPKEAKIARASFFRS